jgi:hypothetical protein
MNNANDHFAGQPGSVPLAQVADQFIANSRPRVPSRTE